MAGGKVTLALQEATEVMIVNPYTLFDGPYPAYTTYEFADVVVLEEV